MNREVTRAAVCFWELLSCLQPGLSNRSGIRARERPQSGSAADSLTLCHTTHWITSICLHIMQITQSYLSIKQTTCVFIYVWERSSPNQLTITIRHINITHVTCATKTPHSHCRHSADALVQTAFQRINLISFIVTLLQMSTACIPLMLIPALIQFIVPPRLCV